jgi:hypothetical protein
MVVLGYHAPGICSVFSHMFPILFMFRNKKIYCHDRKNSQVRVQSVLGDRTLSDALSYGAPTVTAIFGCNNSLTFVSVLFDSLLLFFFPSSSLPVVHWTGMQIV